MNAHCARWHSGGHACPSVMNANQARAWCWAPAGAVKAPARSPARRSGPPSGGLRKRGGEASNISPALTREPANGRLPERCDLESLRRRDRLAVAPHRGSPPDERARRGVSRGRSPAGESHHCLAPRIRQGYPLNLSISISGGKETNRDCLSNGE